MADKPPFDPSQPFEAVKPAFEPSQPFDAVDAPATFAQRFDAAPAAPVNTMADIAKSGGIGVVKGGIGMLGMGGDVGNLIGRGVDMAGSLAGASPEGVEQFKRIAGGALRVHPLTAGPAGFLHGPTSKDIRGDVESVTGPLYEPKTVAGEYAQTAGEFLPAVIGGPESLGVKLLTRVAAPALASETAGQLTKGTAAEPYARLAGAITGGVGAARAVAPRVAAAPTAEALGDAASAAYSHPTVKTLELHPSSTKYAADTIADTLNTTGFRPTTAPQTFGLIKELEIPLAQAALGKTANVADIQGVRTALGKVAGNYANPVEQAAASKAIRGIDDYLANLNPADIAAGDAKAANAILKEARDNYAAKKRVERVDDAEYRAELNAASANSGGNINNATRQALKSILLSPAKRRGFSDDEIAQMEKVVKGSAIGNVARFMGKILATSGMHGAGVVAGSAAAAPLTHGLSLAAPVLGYAARKIGDASTARAIADLDRMIAMRSPLGQAVPGLPAYTKPIFAGAITGANAPLLLQPPNQRR